MMDGERQRRLPWNWGATADEVAERYGCDEQPQIGDLRMIRAVSVAAPAELLWRWLGNLRLAPYSYDWLDNFGRRSPRQLRADLGPVAVGDKAMSVFPVVSVEPGRELTLRTGPIGGRLFGDVLVSYRVVPVGSGARLVGALRFRGADTRLSRARRTAMAWGDVVMMRKQLHTLRDLAERDAAQGRSRAL